MTYEEALALLSRNGQEHLLAYWDELGPGQRDALLTQIATIDFDLMNRLIADWIQSEPPQESFERIEPVPVIPGPDWGRADAREAWAAGEQALRDGRVGLVLVAGGQGTRLGFDGPKGAYPIGPITGKCLFEYHAEKIKNLQRRLGCTLPWYIMVSQANHAATAAFFEERDHFGLEPGDVTFFEQRMVPCVAEEGQFLLDAPDHIAMNPNGHGGCIPALVESGITEDAARRGVDTLSYFQVDNWAVRVADPYFIGYHVLGGGEMSSKIHRKEEPREAVGVHCICDGEYRVIEYTELDIYPQLLETDENGAPIHFAGNPAIHILSTPFVERVFDDYERFPWHRAHKKVPCLDEAGELRKPAEPNAFKFETFVFDALRFTRHEPIAVELRRLGEYTPIKQPEGKNSVAAAREAMNEYWGRWLEKAGYPVPRDAEGSVAINIEVSPEFALYEDEFLEKLPKRAWDRKGDIAIGPDGTLS